MALDEQRLHRQNERFNRAFALGEVDAYLEDLDPDVDIGTVTSLAEGRTLHGREEVRGYLERLHEAFAEMTVEAQSFEEIAEQIVLMIGRWRAMGRASSVSIDSSWAVATHLSPDYRIVWVRAFTDSGAARAAARQRAVSLGLEIQPDPG